MNKVIILIGCSGSGKSTFTKSFLKENPDYVRINRDDLRGSMFDMTDYYKSPLLNQREQLVTKITNTIISKVTLNEGKLIIDNTNTNLKNLQSLLNSLFNLGYKKEDIEFKLFSCDVEVAKSRVKLREGYTSDEQVAYIDKQYQDYLKTVEYLEENYFT